MLGPVNVRLPAWTSLRTTLPLETVPVTGARVSAASEERPKLAPSPLPSWQPARSWSRSASYASTVSATSSHAYVLIVTALPLAVTGAVTGTVNQWQTVFLNLAMSNSAVEPVIFALYQLRGSPLPKAVQKTIGVPPPVHPDSVIVSLP